MTSSLKPATSTWLVGGAAALLLLVGDAAARRPDLVVYKGPDDTLFVGPTGTEPVVNAIQNATSNPAPPDGSQVCSFSITDNLRPGFSLIEGGNRPLATYDEMIFLARAQSTGEPHAPRPTPMMRLIYDDGDDVTHRTLWADLAHYTTGDLFDGSWHEIRIPLESFQTDAAGWGYEVRTIEFAGLNTPAPPGSGYPEPNGVPYNFWFDNMRFSIGDHPVAASSHVVVDRDLVGLVFPDALDSQQLLDTPITVEKSVNGGAFEAVDVIQRGHWDLPHLHYAGYTRTLYTFYVQLAEDLIEGATYRFTYFQGTHEFTFDPMAELCPGIKVNQVGYSEVGSERERYAYLGYWAGDGNWLGDGSAPGTVDYRDNGDVQLLLEADDSVVATITPDLQTADVNDYAGELVMDIDLAAIAVGGPYYLYLPGVGRSHNFEIGPARVFDAFYAVARGLYHQRWNQDKHPDHTSWPRPADHTVVFTAEKTDYTIFDPATPQTGQRSVQGGHHDAGDFDIRPYHAQIASTLMSLVEYFPEKFSDGQLTIPESGNGVPDLLDEGLYQLQAWRDLQEADGGVRLGVESHAHPEWGIFADEDTLPYWTYARNPDVTAYCAGLFAQASRLLADTHPVRSDDYLTRAELAYAYAVANGAMSRNLMQAECHLLKTTTGDPAATATYLARLQSRLAHVSNPVDTAADYVDFAGRWPYNGFNWKFWEPLGNFDFGSLVAYLTADNVPNRDTQILADIEAFILQQTAQTLTFALAPREADSSAYRSTARNSPPNAAGMTGVESWGGSTTPGRVINALWGYILSDVSDKADYLDAISLTADNMLGANARGKCWVVGLGEDHPQQLLDLDSGAWVERFGYDQVAGIPTFGIAPALSVNIPHEVEVWDRHYPDYLTDTPPQRRYLDARPLVPSSEFSVWESCMPAIVTLAMLLPDTPMAPTLELLDYHVNRTPPAYEILAPEFELPVTPFAGARHWFSDFLDDPTSFSIPLAWWRMDDGMGLIATDSSGNENHLTLVEPGIWAGENLTTPPGGDYLNIAADPDHIGEFTTEIAVDFSNGFTLAAWVRVDVESDSKIIELRGTPVNSNAIRMDIGNDTDGSLDGGRLVLSMFGKQKHVDVEAAGWYHVVMVYDPSQGLFGAPALVAADEPPGGEVRFYLSSSPGVDDQTLIGQFPVVAPVAAIQHISVGRDLFSEDTFNGCIDEILLYEGVLDRETYLAGHLNYSNTQSGRRFIVASTTENGLTGMEASLDASNRFVFTDLAPVDEDRVSGWIDTNGNNDYDAGEPLGHAPDGPFQVPPSRDDLVLTLDPVTYPWWRLLFCPIVGVGALLLLAGLSLKMLFKRG